MVPPRTPSDTASSVGARRASPFARASFTRATQASPLRQLEELLLDRGQQPVGGVVVVPAPVDRALTKKAVQERPSRLIPDRSTSRTQAPCGMVARASSTRSAIRRRVGLSPPSRAFTRSY